MQTILSQKGQMVIPARARRLLGLKTGDRLDVKVEGDGLRVIPARTTPRKLKLQRHPVSGVLYAPAEPKAMMVSEAEIRRALADFP